MEELDESFQKYAVDIVLDEMSMCEKILNEWGTFWWETYLNCVLPQEYLDTPPEINDRLDSEVSKIDRATTTNEEMGLPLKSVLLGEKYVCDVSSIGWSRIKSKNAERRVIFNNSGEITFSKNIVHRLKNKGFVDYEGSYNVLSDNFKLCITQYEPIEKHGIISFKTKSMRIELHNATLVITYGDTSIVHNLETGKYVARIIKKREIDKKTYTIFEVKTDDIGNLIEGSLTIDTFKVNGKVNGSYRFNVSRDKGVSANYYSRKGGRINLAQNKNFLESARRLLLGSFKENESSVDSLVLKELYESTERAIDVANGLSKRTLEFDMQDINIRSILDTEKHAVEMLRNLKGEVPLVGFEQRVETFLEMFNIDKEKPYQIRPIES